MAAPVERCEGHPPLSGNAQDMALPSPNNATTKVQREWQLILDVHTKRPYVVIRHWLELGFGLEQYITPTILAAARRGSLAQ